MMNIHAPHSMSRGFAALCAVLALSGCGTALDADGSITATVAPPAVNLDDEVTLCETTADCGDVDHGTCEMVLCVEEGYCLPLPLGNGTPCDDGNACTASEACEAGLCGGGTNECPCENDADCVGLGEGDLCAAGMVCLSEGCGPDPAGPVVCDDLEGDCLITACDPQTGACADAHVPAGSPCDPHDACITGATCTEGGCEGGSPVECPEDGPCVVTSCDPDVGCVDAPADEGAVCNDGNPCSSGDACVGGVCVGEGGACECESDEDCAPFVSDHCTTSMGCEEGACVAYDIVVDCGPAEDPCQIPTCDPATGACGITLAPEGQLCVEPVTCDGVSTCQDGSCVTDPVSCDDGDPCTMDVCDEAFGCTWLPLGGVPCDDGNPCTSEDSCMQGECLPGEDVCVCEGDGDCFGPDFDLCLGKWSCDGGACVVVPGTAVSCDLVPVDPCEVAQCEPTTGACEAAGAPNGTSCDDGDGCTVGDSCHNANCGGEPKPCDDSNPCTDDTCDAVAGCTNVNNTGPCDDGNACTASDLCIAGNCFGGTAVVCPSTLPCTESLCDSAQGCVAVNQPNGSGCDDGVECTSGDHCSNGVCSGESICECQTDEDCGAFENDNVCDGTMVCDGNACVPDPSTVVDCETDSPCLIPVCDPTTGQCSQDAGNEGVACDAGICFKPGVCAGGACFSAPVQCDDGNPCTEDKCSLNSGLCEHLGMDGPCDDDDPCTLGETCKAGECVEAFLFPCDDGDACTIDGCKTGVGCTFTPVDCEDGDLCTEDSCSSQGGCVHEAVQCQGGGLVQCMSGVCDPSTGECKPGFSPNGTPCTDLSPCTLNESCSNGICIAGDLEECDDQNPCTNDVCLPILGCNHTTLPFVPCDDGDACTHVDTCNLNAVCEGSQQDCDDEDPCTSDSCSSGQCIHTPINSPGCQDDVVACDGSNGASCNDQDGDTSADICIQGVCRGFTKQNLYADQSEGNVRLTVVDQAYGHWFMVVEIFGGQVGNVNELIAFGIDGDLSALQIYSETAISPKWSHMHNGFAVNEGGELWRYQPNSDSWSGENDLGDTFIEKNLVEPSGIWVHRPNNHDVELWAIGEPNEQATPVLHCTEVLKGNGSVDVDCDGQTIGINEDNEELHAVSGTATCAGGECSYHMILGADYPQNNGYLTDVFENDGGDEDVWENTFFDGSAQNGHVTHDIASLGGERYVIVGGGGYMRYRASNGNFTWISNLKEGQSQRTFRGAWSGAGTVAVAATRSSGGTPDFELWTVSTSADILSGQSWSVVKLGDLSSGSVLHDVWGDAQGNLCLVGEEVLQSGATAAVLYRRAP